MINNNFNLPLPLCAPLYRMQSVGVTLLVDCRWVARGDQVGNRWESGWEQMSCQTGGRCHLPRAKKVQHVYLKGWLNFICWQIIGYSLFGCHLCNIANDCSYNKTHVHFHFCHSKFFLTVAFFKFFSKYSIKETKGTCSDPSGMSLIHCMGGLKIKLPPCSRIFVTALKWLGRI